MKKYTIPKQTPIEIAIQCIPNRKRNRAIIPVDTFKYGIIFLNSSFIHVRFHEGNTFLFLNSA
jgi:hypothetical protein